MEEDLARQASAPNGSAGANQVSHEERKRWTATEFKRGLEKQLTSRAQSRKRTRRSRRSAQRAGKRKRKKELAWSKSRDEYWNDKARLEVERYQNELKHLCGFLANPSKELWENIKDYYNNMVPRTYPVGRPTNMACHNLCMINKAPEGTESFLGLGERYCVQRMTLDPKLTDTITSRLEKSIRWKYIFRLERDEGNYKPGMYVPSDKEPDKASAEIESCLANFKQKVTEARRKYNRRKATPNITTMQIALMNRLRKDKRYRTMPADKGCGQSLIDTEIYTERAVSDHLSDSEVYKILSKREATAQTKGVAMIIERFITDNQDALTDYESTYLRRGLK